MLGGTETNQPNPMAMIVHMRRELETLKRKNEEEIQRMKRENEEEIEALKKENALMKQKLNNTSSNYRRG